MSRSKIIVIAFVIILLINLNAPLCAQTDQPMPFPPEQFNFSFDYALFQTKQDIVLMELYYSILRDHLKFIPDSSSWKATFVFQAEAWQNDSLVAANQWKNVNSVDSLSQIKSNHRLYGVGFFALKPGDYLLKIKMVDLNSNYNRQYQTNISIPLFSADKVELSDIQLASQIKKSSQQSRFYKNGYLVIPNTERFYGTGMPMLMFYTEIYNLKKENEGDTTKYSVNYKILDGDGQPVRSFPEKIRTKPGNSAVEVSGMNIISFPSGTYYLEVNVKDLYSGETASRRKKFFIYRQGDVAQSDSLSQEQMRKRLEAAYKRIYSNMNVKEIDEEFASAIYISTKQERKIYKKLDNKGKQAFMMEFWRKRDKTPDTPRNEFRENYLALVRTANEKFGGFRKGWKTDRGRILLTYGVPDEIERAPYSAEHKPYVIWKYFSLQGGVIFVFVDKRDYGKYELVHSTARGELNDPQWERWIRPN